MKKILLSVVFLLLACGGYAQVGIGTTTPDKAAQLDVVAEDRGVLIPRVALQAIDSHKPVAALSNNMPNSLLVFNTTVLEDEKDKSKSLSQGYYYWSTAGKKWIKLVDISDLSDLNTAKKIIESEVSLEIKDRDVIMVLGKPIASDITITLPDPTKNNGRRITIKKADQDEGKYINVEGYQGGLYTAVPGTGWEFLCNGANWIISNKF